MHHEQAVTLRLPLLGGCAGPTLTPTVPAAEQGTAPSMAPQELAAEFRRLRAVQGHFQGGRWNADVDAWAGRKHQIMIELGSCLGWAGCRRGQVTDLLGPPDLLVGPGHLVFDRVIREAEFEKPRGKPYKLLIYYWRGAHDLLYFASSGGAILGSGWWHAYD
jgi:hypothetical protein